jgi:hypothetical protein
MKKENMMSIANDQETIWTLSTDRRTIRFALPPMTLAGMPEPINVSIDFDARTIEAILDRLTILRSQMLPAPPTPNKRN